MLDDAFQIGTDTALSDLSQRPRAPKPQEPAFSLWGLTRAPDRGVRAGVAEGIASTAEVLGAFGQVLSSTGGSAEGMFFTGTEAERRERDEQARRIREEGVDYRSEAGRSFRNVAREFMPDPVTSHGAEVAVAEFARLGSKAVAAGVTMGPLAGAAVAGAEEGFTASEKLADQGVDVPTRTKVGAATGLLTGLGFGLPVAGKTIAGTVGLALAGGPASFITQQAATREILASAGYDQLAEQYDPFDPVGLTLSTLLPLGFGAMAMRNAARARAKVDAGHVDAARVSLLREQVDAAKLGDEADIAGAQAHQTAVTRAIDQMAEGQRVEVSDLISEPVARQITEAMDARLAEVRPDIEAAQVRQGAEPTARVEPQRYDIARLADEARGLMDEGRPAGEVIGRLKASGTEVSPEMQNMLVGLSEFGNRLDELVGAFRSAETSKPGAPVQDLVADAVESLRAGGQQKSQPSPAQARLDSLIVGNPTALEGKMPIAFDDQGRATQSVSMREFLDTVKRESQQDAAEAELIQVAAMCFLSGGA